MKILVLGSGTMGSGIGEVFALKGHEVILYDTFPQALEKAMKNIRWSVEKLAEKGKVKDPQEVMSRITTTGSLTSISDRDMIVEAVPEDMRLKKEVLGKVSRANTSAIISSNTSSLPITEMSEAVERPERFLGTHFFNPPVIMGLVEVIKGQRTSEDIFKRTGELVKSLDKYPVMVRKDVTGFVVNRILFRIFTSACDLLNKYTVQEIDSVAHHVLHFPMGVFVLADFTGIDVNYLIGKEVRERGLNFKCSAIDELYSKGHYGAKTGKGFYDWSKGRPEIPKTDRGPSPVEIIGEALREAKWIVDNGVATEEDVNMGTRLGLGLPIGILEYTKYLH